MSVESIKCLVTQSTEVSQTMVDVNKMAKLLIQKILVTKRKMRLHTAAHALNSSPR